MTHDPASEGESATATLLRMMRGYWISQAIFTAARLNLADLLEQGPVSCEVLATHTGVPARSLYRLLRALASVGIFTEVGDGTFGLTPLAEPLRSHVPDSLHASGVYYSYTSRMWNELLPALQTGQPQFARVFGAELWAYLAAHPEVSEPFQEMMADLNVRTTPAVTTAYDFSADKLVVDVGGGHGSQIAAILQANPGLSGMLFDLPYVLEQARHRLATVGVVDRCRLVSGDFFQSVPEGGDVYLLRWILHDYEDERSLRILRNCRAAMPPHGRLLVIETVVPEVESPDSWVPKFHDLQMLHSIGGEERTEAEYRELFTAAGLRLQRVIPTQSPMSVLEGVPS